MRQHYAHTKTAEMKRTEKYESMLLRTLILIKGKKKTGTSTWRNCPELSIQTRHWTDQ